jgi:hypothetical protein
MPGGEKERLGTQRLSVKTGEPPLPFIIAPVPRGIRSRTVITETQAAPPFDDNFRGKLVSEAETFYLGGC